MAINQPINCQASYGPVPWEPKSWNSRLLVTAPTLLPVDWSISSFLHFFISPFLDFFISPLLHFSIYSFRHCFISTFLHFSISSFLHSFMSSCLHFFIYSLLHYLIASILHSFISVVLHFFISSPQRFAVPQFQISKFKMEHAFSKLVDFWDFEISKIWFSKMMKVCFL